MDFVIWHWLIVFENIWFGFCSEIFYFLYEFYTIFTTFYTGHFCTEFFLNRLFYTGLFIDSVLDNPLKLIGTGTKVKKILINVTLPVSFKKNLIIIYLYKLNWIYAAFIKKIPVWWKTHELSFFALFCLLKGVFSLDSVDRT